MDITLVVGMQGQIHDGEILSNGFLLSNRYEISRFIGGGGMGNVYLAYDRLLEDHPVALKVLHREYSRDGDLRKRFLREVRLMHLVNHENVVRTYDVGAHDNLLYFTMEYVPGDLLDRCIDSERIDYPVLVSLTTQICAGLGAIHNADIVHRDLKPGNVIVSPEGVAKITDFGVARPSTSRLTQHKEIMGSLDYMAPEIWQGDTLTQAVDFYSLGVILYELVCGCQLFEGAEPAALMWKHVKQHPLPPHEHNPDVPDWLNSIILRLLEKDPALRPQSAQEIIELLNAPQDSLSEEEPNSAEVTAAAAENQKPVEQEASQGVQSPDTQDPDLIQDADSRKALLSITNACDDIIFDDMPTMDAIIKHQKRVSTEGVAPAQHQDAVTSKEELSELRSLRRSIVVLAIILAFSLGGALYLLFGSLDTNVHITMIKEAPEAPQYYETENGQFVELTLTRRILKSLAERLERENDETRIDAGDSGGAKASLPAVNFSIPRIEGKTYKTAKNAESTFGDTISFSKFSLGGLLQRYPSLNSLFADSPLQQENAFDTLPSYESVSKKRGVWDDVRDLSSQLSVIDAKLAVLDTDANDRGSRSVRIGPELREISKASEEVEKKLGIEVEKYNLWAKLSMKLEEEEIGALAKQLPMKVESIETAQRAYQEASNAYLRTVETWSAKGKDQTHAEALRAQGQNLKMQREALRRALTGTIYQSLSVSMSNLLSLTNTSDSLKSRQEKLLVEKRLSKQYRDEGSSVIPQSKESLLAERNQIQGKLQSLKQQLRPEEELLLRQDDVLKGR